MDNGYSLSDIATATGDGMGGCNSWVLIILFALIFGNGGMFGNNGSGVATHADVDRSMQFSSLRDGQASIEAELQRGIYEINNNTNHVAYDNLGEIRDVQASIAQGFANQQNYCCEIKQGIMENRYLDEKNKAELQATIHAEGEATRSLIQQNKIEALQQKVQSMELQLATGNTVKYPTQSAWVLNGNPFCGCSCGF